MWVCVREREREDNIKKNILLYLDSALLSLFVWPGVGGVSLFNYYVRGDVKTINTGIGTRRWRGARGIRCADDVREPSKANASETISRRNVITESLFTLRIDEP